RSEVHQHTFIDNRAFGPRRPPILASSMPHVIEPATSGRAKCRACDRPIAKGEPRFGERQPNAFGDGEMTLWFHLSCGAYVRPEAFLEASAAADSNVTPALADAAKAGIEHRRL